MSTPPKVHALPHIVRHCQLEKTTDSTDHHIAASVMPGGNFNNKRHAQGSNKSEDKKRRRENETNWKNTRGDAPTDARYAPQIMTNQRFEAFYKAQGFVKEDEWSNFMGALGRSLPACFRINTDYAFSEQLKEQLLSFVGKSIVLDGVAIDAVQQMSWYPSAYKLGTDRKSIRKLPGLEGLHKWMMQHTDSGNITRQEAGITALFRTISRTLICSKPRMYEAHHQNSIC